MDKTVIQGPECAINLRLVFKLMFSAEHVIGQCSWGVIPIGLESVQAYLFIDSILTEWLYPGQEIVVNDHILDSNRVVELLVWFAVSTKLDFDFFQFDFFVNTWPLFWFILRFFIVFMVFTVENFYGIRLKI